MFAKVLVANRGEIAVRAFRAAYELGAQTVAVFPYEDRNAVHRIKADEAYTIGERGHPVRAYLDIAEIIRAARESGADAIYPGYGFLSENPDLARACDAAGITFIGPPAEVLELAGNKVRALAAAKAAGIPTLRSTPPSADLDELVAGAEEIGFPVFVKAVAGGGGRGMRRVDDPAQLRELTSAAMREAEGAFGDPTAFIEQAVGRPRHIEVQILADTQGTTLHLFERDCSIQRRHQKVIEIAPAPHISDELRAALCADAVKFAESINYSCAGTVEFLVETEGQRAGQHVFIEMNPRIQVEHTVTEEITDVDLVQAQMRIAVRGEPGRPRPVPGRDPDQRRRPAVPDHHRGPGQRVPPRHRHHHRLPHRGRRGRTARRRHRRHRRGDQRPLRLDAGQADLPRPDVRGGGGPGPAGAGRVPDPRRQHQHPLPAGRAGGPRLHRRRRLHRLHRAAPGAADHPRAGRPRHQAAALAGRGDGQPAARPGPDPPRPGGQAAGRGRPDRAVAAGLAAAAARARAGGVRRRPARSGSGSRSPTPPSATPTSRCWPPGSGPRTCCGSPRTSAG